MKMQWLFMIGLLGCNIMTHAKEIPACFLAQITPEKLLSSIPPLALYEVEIAGKKLYRFEKDQSKLRFVRAPQIPLFDSDCQVVYAIEAYEYKNQVTVLDTLWVNHRPRTNIKLGDFLNSQRKFKVHYIDDGFKGDFALKRHQRFILSAKNGLQILSNGKVIRSYKIIPRKQLIYDPHSQKITPQFEDITNALLLEHQGKYWLLYARDAFGFELIPADQNGNFAAQTKRYYLEILSE